MTDTSPLKKLIAKATQKPLPKLFCRLCDREIRDRNDARLTWWIDDRSCIRAAGVMHQACCLVRSLEDDEGHVWFLHAQHATSVNFETFHELQVKYATWHWDVSAALDFANDGLLLARWFGMENRP